MNKVAFERPLAEFSSTIELPELSFDEDGMAYVTVDDSHLIIFRR
ncbi:type III secretion system chaperone [Dyella sp. M7H15-1]|nr:type III secretion system chaperone [Dyella sp. M7H15-1]